MGVITAIGFLIGRHTDLATLIQLLTTVMVIVQALAQIVAVTVLRRRQPGLRRPYACGSTRCRAPSPSPAGA